MDIFFERSKLRAVNHSNPTSATALVSPNDEQIITADMDTLNRACVLSDEPWGIGARAFSARAGDVVPLAYAGQTGARGRIVRRYQAGTSVRMDIAVIGAR